MKYLADDGSKFDSEQLCLEYEQSREKIAEVRARVEKHLKLKGIKDRAINREIGKVMWWVEIDAKERPEAYGIVYGDLDKEPAVNPMSTEYYRQKIAEMDKELDAQECV